jgi:uncharacterized protein (DUF58 family)
LLTRKVGLTVAFALWVFALGLVLRDDLLLLGVVPIVIYVVLLDITEPRPHLDVRVERSSGSGIIYEGEEARLMLKVENLGPPIAALEVFDTLPPGLEVREGSNHIVTSLKRGEARTFSYSVGAPLFGSYELGPIRLRSTDLARNHAEEEVLESPSTLWVYPDVRYLSKISIKPRRPRNWPGETTTRRAGMGIDFYGIKDYVPGDAFRRVNWKASARADRTLINQYLDESGGDIMIAMDFRLASEVGLPPDSTLTQSTRAAAAIAYRLLRDRNRVGLIGIGDDLVKVLPGFGRRQFERIVAGLLILKPGDGWDMGNLPKVLSLYFSRQTQIVAISPLLDEKSCETIVETSNAGYRVVVVSPSPIGIRTAGETGRGVEGLVALRLARLERETRLSRLRRYAAVLDWDTSEPLGDAVRSLVELRSH